GREFHISGTPAKGAKRFNINIAEAKIPHNDVPFHFDVRFSGNVTNKIVCNSWRNGSWGKEEILKESLDLAVGTHFEITITVQKLSYVVKLNNVQVKVFHQRTVPAEENNLLIIEGHVDNVKVKM
ncbi:unnamed protein product, partial [Lymnaea stagnalis]